jgi:hypothetical protein
MLEPIPACLFTPRVPHVILLARVEEPPSGHPAELLTLCSVRLCTAISPANIAIESSVS